MAPRKSSPSPQITFQAPPGHKPPTPEEIKELQRKLEVDAAKNGVTVPEFIEMIKAQAKAQKQNKTAPFAGDDDDELLSQPIKPGPPTPAALAVANFLKGQDLKVRTCILDGQRKDMFKGRPPAYRALRALQSPAYESARKKNPVLPEISDRPSLENAFKLLPMSLLALRVSKVDPNKSKDGLPAASKKKRVKGLWTVEIEQHQECREELHFVWLFEGSQLRQKLYAAGALAIVFTIVMFPLWPIQLRIGVWYLSLGMMGLLCLFFLMAIFRLILFVITMFTHSPGLWLYPNLFEDVGFMDSFRPVWGWQKTKKGKKKAKVTGSSNAGATMAAMTGQPPPASATTSSTAPQIDVSKSPQRRLTPKVEDAIDED
ncbi:unnamed protein product [Blumeria hordei]|uniref:Translocation protein SEC62 n=1 Tax=Blumeria hordei TaxID=2867405 RepID=A0A383UMP8_BLUHO|nr:unnamed protein product [Blumeria hordei]